MKTKIILFALAIITIYCLGLMFLPDREKKEDLYLKKLELLESKLDSLSSKKDSIRTIVVTIEKEIEINAKNHEKIVNTIINSNDSANFAWIEQYIEAYKRHNNSSVNIR